MNEDLLLFIGMTPNNIGTLRAMMTNLLRKVAQISGVRSAVCLQILSLMSDNFSVLDPRKTEA